VSEEIISSNAFPLLSLTSALQPNDGVLEFKSTNRNKSGPCFFYLFIVSVFSELEGA